VAFRQTKRHIVIMIIAELLARFSETVKIAVEELFTHAYTNQTHTQDLLLVDQHGFYSPLLSNAKLSDNRKLSPYVIGPDWIGFADHTDYEFIDWYRQSGQININKDEFIKEVKKNSEIEIAEKISIQIEKLIYLKFWESDLNLKKIYQLTSLAIGKPYDWHFNIPSNLRKGSKHEIIRKEIRDKIEEICPRFFNLIQTNYKTQIRNAIAHSQFSITGRSIYYLNYSKDPKAFCPIKGITFDQWYELFHHTLLFHNELLHQFQIYRDKYFDKTKQNGNCIEVRIIHENGSEQYKNLGIMKSRKEWIWHENLSKDDF
jgi:hypothetical protein